MPGYVNYKYDKDDGSLPTHTKSSFQKYKILTVHGIITKNALLLMQKVIRKDLLLPISIHDLFDKNAPCFSEDPDYISHKEWYEKYNSTTFRPSLFFKAPMLAIDEDFLKLLSESSDSNNGHYSCLKNTLKTLLLQKQSQGETDQWPTFLLNNMNGLRKSTRK